jgi:hypothetical protein
MLGYLRPTNYIEDLEEIIRQVRAKLRKKKSPTTLSEEDQLRRSLTRVFETMANKTLCEFSAPTTLISGLDQQSMWEKKDSSSSQP